MLVSSTNKTVAVKLVGHNRAVEAIEKKIGKPLDRCMEGHQEQSDKSTGVYFLKGHNHYAARQILDIDTVQYLFFTDFKKHLGELCRNARYADLHADNRIIEIVAEKRTDVEKACILLKTFLSRIVKKEIDVSKQGLEFLQEVNVFLHLQLKLRRVRSYLQITDKVVLWSDNDNNLAHAEKVFSNNYSFVLVQDNSGQTERLCSVLEKSRKKIKIFYAQDRACLIMYVKDMEILAFKAKRILETESNPYVRDVQLPDSIIRYAIAGRDQFCVTGQTDMTGIRKYGGRPKVKGQYVRNLVSKFENHSPKHEITKRCMESPRPFMDTQTAHIHDVSDFDEEPKIPQQTQIPGEDAATRLNERQDIISAEQTVIPPAKRKGQSALKITVTGTKENVDDAKTHIEEELTQRNKYATKHITDVSSAVFAAVRELNDIEMTFLDGVNIEYVKDRDEIVLTGHTDLVDDVFITLDGYLNNVKKMHMHEMRVTEISTTSVDEVIRDVRDSRSGVCYIFDKNIGIVTIFADSEKNLNDILEELQRKLRLADSYAFSLVNLSEMDMSDTEKYLESTSSKTVKPFIPRIISLSKDSKHLRVYQHKDIVVKVYQTNIIEVPVDGIVNAANKDLQHCGGEACVIAKAAGTALIRESEALAQKNKGPYDVTSVVCTSAGSLGYKYILHAVGPSWSNYQPITKSSLRKCEQDVKQTVLECLQLADERKLTKIALPSISSGGISLVPNDVCAMQYARAVMEFSSNSRSLEEIHFVDTSADMICTIHKVFDAMITQGKPAPFDTRVYIEQTTAPDTKVCVTKENKRPIKNTARGRPKSLAHSAIDNEQTEAVFAHIPTRMNMQLTAAKGNAHEVKKVCPTCLKVCGIITGDQPDGNMEIIKRSSSLAGYEQNKSIAITYRFVAGIQRPDHPRPGSPYKGITRRAYLPDNDEGREICAMLKVAFEHRLVFTIRTSITTEEEGVITLNNIHHKIDPRPNTLYGYPDKTYLQRVREELEDKGVSVQDIEYQIIKELKKDSFSRSFTAYTQY